MVISVDEDDLIDVICDELLRLNPTADGIRLSESRAGSIASRIREQLLQLSTPPKPHEPVKAKRKQPKKQAHKK